MLPLSFLSKTYHDKADVCEIVGTKHSLGKDRSDAEQSVDAIEVLTSTTEDYWKDGPHPVDIFAYTQETTVAVFRPALEMWKNVKNELTNASDGMKQLFFLAPNRATRVTIGRKEGEDILISEEDYIPEVQKAFAVNCVSEEGLHGARGAVNLVVSVPERIHITLIEPGAIKLSYLRNDLTLVSGMGGHAALDSIEGKVCLCGVHLTEARNIKGQLAQYFHFVGGRNMRTEPDIYQPAESFETKLSNISGEIDLDVGKVDIEASKIDGETRIRNRFGMTRFLQASPEMSGRCQIHSISGNVHFFLNQNALDSISIAARIQFGKVFWRGVKGIQYGTWNTSKELNAQTLPYAKRDRADVHLETEAGEIYIEKIPTG